MYRVKSHLWPVSRAFLNLLSLGYQFMLHVWAKIVPRARFSLPLHNLHFSPSKIDGCFGYIRTCGSLVASCSPFALSTCKSQGMFRLKSHFWPAWRLHPLLVVSDPRIIAFWRLKDTYSTSFSRLRSAFEKNTYLTVLSRPCVACANGANRPEGRFSQTHWSFFRSDREAAIVFWTYKGPNFIIKYNGFRNSSRKSRIASENP